MSGILKSKKQYIFQPSLLILTCLCLVVPSGKLSKAAWLTGTWKHISTGGAIYENWKKESENTLVGMSYTVKEGDTIVFETIQLTEKNDSLLYIPKVKYQNDEQPVIFTATIITNEKMVFRNDQHDFPQIISYTKITKDSMVAEISGSAEGILKSRAYPMVRIE